MLGTKTQSKTERLGKKEMSLDRSSGFNGSAALEPRLSIAQQAAQAAHKAALDRVREALPRGRFEDVGAVAARSGIKAVGALIRELEEVEGVVFRHPWNPRQICRCITLARADMRGPILSILSGGRAGEG